jgi:hypothetical protein
VKGGTWRASSIAYTQTASMAAFGAFPRLSWPIVRIQHLTRGLSSRPPKRRPGRDGGRRGRGPGARGGTDWGPRGSAAGRSPGRDDHPLSAAVARPLGPGFGRGVRRGGGRGRAEARAGGRNPAATPQRPAAALAPHGIRRCGSAGGSAPRPRGPATLPQRRSPCPAWTLRRCGSFGRGPPRKRRSSRRDPQPKRCRNAESLARHGRCGVAAILGGGAAKTPGAAATTSGARCGCVGRDQGARACPDRVKPEPVLLDKFLVDQK